MRTRLTAALVLVLLVCAGCAGDGAGAPVGPAAGSTSASVDATTRTCLSRQKGGYDRVHQAVQELVGTALRQPYYVPAAPIDEVRYRVTVLPDETDPPCDSPLTPLRDAVSALEPGAIDEPALRRVVTELDRWRAALGREEPRIRYEARTFPIDTSGLCPLLRRSVEVTYEVRYRVGPAGRRGWISVAVDSDLDHALTIGHDGVGWVEGPRSGAARQRVRWGASSVDYSTAWPGRVTHHVVWAGGRTPRVQLQPDGRIVPIRVGVFATSEKLGVSCGLPVAHRAG